MCMCVCVFASDKAVYSYSALINSNCHKHKHILYVYSLLFQTDDPFCSEVDSSVLENLETCVGFELSGVLIEKIDSCKEK